MLFLSEDSASKNAGMLFIVPAFSIIKRYGRCSRMSISAMMRQKNMIIPADSISGFSKKSGIFICVLWGEDGHSHYQILPVTG